MTDFCCRISICICWRVLVDLWRGDRNLTHKWWNSFADYWRRLYFKIAATARCSLRLQADKQILIFWPQCHPAHIVCAPPSWVQQGVFLTECFSFQDELDDVLETWNDHYIRRSRNVSVPSGRPNIMYSCPLLYGAEDECCAVDTTDLDICKQHCIFRTLQPCEDEDVYNLCLTLMMQHNLSLPNDPSCGVELYRKLRMEIMALL